jgi:hypothetical protein
MSIKLNTFRAFFLSFPLLFGIFALSSCQGQTQNAPTTKATKKMDQATTIKNEKMDTATFC